jgi:hypothetical protein
VSDSSTDHGSKTKLSRRKFLSGSVATLAGAGAVVSGLSAIGERAEAFYNMAFMRKQVSTGGLSPCIGGAPIASRAIGS